MTWYSRYGIAIAWLCALPSTALANTNATPERDSELSFGARPIALELRTGLSTSVGLLGLVGELTPLDRVTIGGGIGNNGLGRIWGAHLRARPLLFRPDRHGNVGAITIESAYSRSRYQGLNLGDFASSICEGDPSDPHGNCYSPNVVPQMVSWLQVELGAELRFRSGVSLRGSFGVATSLRAPHWQCTSHGQPAPCAEWQPAQSLPVVTLAVGYAF